MEGVFHMNINQVVINNLLLKFAEIKNRMTAAIDQPSDEDINWRPDEESNSIAKLVLHIAGNILQRVEGGIGWPEDTRDRDGEFDRRQILKKEETIKIVTEKFAVLEKTIRRVSVEDLLRPQKVRQNSVTIMDI
jgi:hypothetical protein